MTPAPYWARPAREAVGTAAVPAPVAPPLEWPQCPDLRPGWRVSIRPQPTRAPQGEAMALGPPRGAGVSPGSGAGPHAALGGWRYDRGHRRRGTAAPPSAGRGRDGGRRCPPPDPLPPHEGEQGLVEPADDARCLTKERGGQGARAPLPSTPTPGPQRPGLVPFRPAASLFRTWRVDQEAADGDEAGDGGVGTRPWPPPPPSQHTHTECFTQDRSADTRNWQREAESCPKRPRQAGLGVLQAVQHPIVELVAKGYRLVYTDGSSNRLSHKDMRSAGGFGVFATEDEQGPEVRLCGYVPTRHNQTNNGVVGSRGF